MFNILAVIITVLSIVIIFVFFLTDSKKINPRSLINPKPVSDTLGKSISTVGDSVEDTKENLGKTSTDSINNIKETVHAQAQAALDTIFGKEEDKANLLLRNKKETAIVNVINTPLPQEKAINLYSIDLSKETNLKVNMVKNKKYYFKFENIPGDFCLYINDQKIELQSGRIVEIQFSSSGSFPMKANTCNVAERNIGEITVE